MVVADRRRLSTLRNGSRPVTRASASLTWARGKKRPARQPHTRRTAAAEIRHLGEQLGELDILAAENIALANSPEAQSGEMAGGDIGHMDDGEAGVDIGRHIAAHRLEHDAPGRRRADVAGPERRGWIDDDGRQSVALDHLLDQTLGEELAALIGAETVADLEPARLVAEAGGVRRQVATLLVWTMRSTPARSASSITVRVPSTLVRITARGSGAQSR